MIDKLANHYSAWEIELFFDGECPLCLREINVLKRWDKNSKIRFTDFSLPSFNMIQTGLTYDELMSQIHGRLPNGEFITGVEVFRKLYAAVGFSGLVFLSRLPIVSHMLSAAYWLFARNRLRLTGRCNASCKVGRTA